MPVTATTLVNLGPSSSPTDITVIGDTFYVVDASQNCILKITPNGTVTIFAGSVKGYADGMGINARFNRPGGITAIGDTLYVADTYNNRIRKITPDGNVSTIAGSPIMGYTDGVGIEAKFNVPYRITAVGNTLYVTDSSNNQLRKIDPDGTVTTIAGMDYGYADGKGEDAQFKSLAGVTSIGENIYVADFGNDRIRKITPDGNVTTIAGSERGYSDGIGTDAQFHYPSAVAAIGKDLYVADTYNHRIRKITPNGKVTTVAGSTQGYADDVGIKVKFWYPEGLVAVDKMLYVADTMNHCIRRLTIIPDPTNENISRKRNAMEEIRTLPSMGIFPGGIEVQEAEERFQKAQNIRRGTISRKRNAMEEIRTLPSMGIFPGGIEVQEAEERFQKAQNIRRGNKKSSRRTRKRKTYRKRV